ncbi:F-box/kelch-repeat protein At1g55270 isoform X2 [Selaginella moellendorffii]|uniref:F-box/kelch-repeat protein At1g55270 isoform X2 n=1 Tax=Selaginella moellendorffii TaxID=88036 RepID=UPI000D1C5AAC|nr:F-box/kelch-repeat protein At1g55270 isoform X2 [Selaginella moellendorffii]|eukprot:XP_024520813.1 F-box/kelch-repeat protein At1g55270 isoform X2 [Selaginella moellendorffii]
MATTIIPGLDSDAAYQCLLRVSLSSHGQMRKGLDEEWLVATVILRQEDELLIMAFNPSSSKKAWMVLPPPPRGFYAAGGFDCRALGSKLYLLGLGGKSLSVFDSHTNRWSAAAPMLCPRFSFASAAMEGQLYVVGGNRERQEQDAETYNPLEDRWYPLPPLPPHGTMAFRNALVVDGNKMVILRAVNGETLVFSAQDHSWEVADMTRLRGCRCIVHGNRIYDANTLQRYDSGNNSWEALQLTNASSSDSKSVFHGVSCQKNIWAVKEDCKVVKVIQVPNDGSLEAKVMAVYELSVPFSNLYPTFDLEVLRA